MEADPWSVYWQADNLDSCVAIADKRDSELISEFWQGFARELKKGSTVLDLATGNGTVPLSLLRGDDTLQITGIDKAAIDPNRYLSSPERLSNVRFMGGVDVCDLPFDPCSFEAVTSQFGIEYAPIAQAIDSTEKVLAPGGKLRFLLHHSGSAIVGPTHVKLREMNSLLRPGGVIEKITAFAGHKAGAEEVELAGKQHLLADVGRSSGITGQIFEGVNRVMQSRQSGDHVIGRQLVETMALRLGADRDRLTQLTEVALTQGQIKLFAEELEQAGVAVDRTQTFSVTDERGEDVLIGWQVRGEKR